MGHKRPHSPSKASDEDVDNVEVARMESEEQAKKRSKVSASTYDVTGGGEDDDDEGTVEIAALQFADAHVRLPTYASEPEKDEKEDVEEEDDLEDAFKSHVAGALVSAHGLLTDDPSPTSTSPASSSSEDRFHSFQALRFQARIVTTIMQEAQKQQQSKGSKEPHPLRALIESLDKYSAFKMQDEDEDGHGQKEVVKEGQQKGVADTAVRAMAAALVQAALLQTEYARGSGVEEDAMLRSVRVLQSGVLQREEARRAAKVYALTMCAFARGLRHKASLPSEKENDSTAGESKALDVMGALKDAAAAIALDEHFSYAWEIRAQIYTADKQWDRALEDATRAVQCNKTDSRSLNLRGSLLADHLKQYDRALEDFTKGVMIDHRSQTFSLCQLKRVALYWNRLGNMERAVIDLIDVTDESEDPEDVEAAESFISQELLFDKEGTKPLVYKALFDAVLAHKRTQADKAMQILNTAAKDLKNDKVAMSLVHFLRGMVHSNLMDLFEQALTDFDSALEGNHLSTETRLNILNAKGVLLSDGMERPKEAITVLDAAVILVEEGKLKGEIARDTFANKAKIYSSNLEKHAEAVELFKCASAAMDDKDSYTLFIIGNVYDDDLNEPKKALEYYTKAIELDGNRAEYYGARAELYREKLGDEELAKQDETVAILLRANEMGGMDDDDDDDGPNGGFMILGDDFDIDDEEDEE